MMYHHLSVNASQLLCANLPVNKNMGDILAAECALFTGCSDVMLINIDTFASFSALYLCVSDIFLTHTQERRINNVRAYARVIYTIYNENNSLQRYSAEYPCRLFSSFYPTRKRINNCNYSFKIM